MLQLFKTEIKKFKYNSTIKLLIIFFIALMPASILLLKGIFKDATGPIKVISEIYDLPMIWDYQGYAGSWFVFFFLGFAVIQMFTSEVSYKTMRQNIITGYTKKEYFMSKLIVIVVLSILATVIYTLSAAIIGMLHTPGFDLELLMDNNWAITRFFIMSLGTLSFALLISVVFRKGSLAMFMYFAWPLIIEPLLRWATVYFVLESGNPKFTIMNYFPCNTIEDLMVFPLVRTSSDFISVNADMTVVHPYSIAIGMSIVYTLLFIFLAWKKFKDSDV